MWSGRLAKARRGELAVPLPAGFVRRPSGEVVLDPDEQVQAVVRLVFDLFDRLGTVNAVLCFLADNHIQLGVRLREGPGARGAGVAPAQPGRGAEHAAQSGLRWDLRLWPQHDWIPGGGSRAAVHRPGPDRARGQWLVFLPGVLPGLYQHRAVRAEHGSDWTPTGPASQSMGAVRDGPALLAGLVACGRCGKKMTVRYQRGPGGKLHPVYVCAREKTDYGAGQCQQLAGPCVDALRHRAAAGRAGPAALEVSLAAAGQVEAQRAQVDRIWRQRLERADFAADRARRQYQLAEPENRLVVRQLEKDWEAALAERQRLGEEYDRFTAARPRTLTAAEREPDPGPGR